MVSYVYFIKTFKESPLIKIGYSKNPKKRLSVLQIGSASKLQLMGVIKCKDESHAKSIEKLAHNIFYKQRKRGEWFRLSEKHEQQLISLIEKCTQA